jgi:hypothetical protein
MQVALVDTHRAAIAVEIPTELRASRLAVFGGDNRAMTILLPTRGASRAKDDDSA